MKTEPIWTITSGDMTAGSYIFTALNSGQLDSDGVKIPPTPRRISVTLMNMQRVADGLIVEAHDAYDTADVYGQLGLL
jgi:predicted ester cyclase